MNSLLYKIRRKSYLLFFAKLVLIIFTVGILDFITGNILEHYYFKQENGRLYETTYAIENTKEDLLIFGSSRANHHYIPSIFEQRLSMSGYNAGSDGYFMLYHYAVLKGILKRYSPKVIILDLTKGEFGIDDTHYDRLSILLPYYKRHPEIRDVVNLRGSFEKVKLLSKIYPYNSLLFTIIAGNSELNKTRKEYLQGYMPLRYLWNKPLKTIEGEEEYIIDTNKIKAYENFLKDCTGAGVKVFVICSPYFIKENHTDYSIKLGEEIADKYNVPFLDYSGSAFFLNSPQLFADERHLCNDGAEIFSRMVADTINTILKTSPAKP